MPQLAASPNLSDLQTYVQQLEVERGFTGNTVQQSCLLISKEIGELSKAIRKQQNMKLDSNSKVGSVDEELADILIYLCAIANRLDIDLEHAFRHKEEINKQRVWQSSSQSAERK